MKPTIGFVLVTHQNPDQILFLCSRLSSLFGDPPIAIHHDFSQNPLDRAQFPANIRFVDRTVRTGWGVMGVVDALLAALRLLYKSDDGWGDPDWFVSLSSADYPIQTAATILNQLEASPFDGYLDSREIYDYGGTFLDQKLREFPFQQPRYHQFAFNRYVAIPLLPLKFARRMSIPIERYCIHSPWVTTRLTPFRDGVKCFGGDAWMTLRRKLAHILLDETPLWRTLHRHYRSRSVPEESFYHTLLGNTPGLNLSPDNLRYTDWKGCYAHPRTLNQGDIPRLLASTHHFARKFPFDPNLLGELDSAVSTQKLPAMTLERTHA